jgi:hypothetical protein
MHGRIKTVAAPLVATHYSLQGSKTRSSIGRTSIQEIVKALLVRFAYAYEVSYYYFYLCIIDDTGIGSTIAQEVPPAPHHSRDCVCSMVWKQAQCWC